ncbi:hypothetical protein MG293_000474 [Ovis ammon polii]|uniref:Uncharacterized protein n=1 Tax=Ovis ammon polii TaxID=230172 RepID=A0AAD4UNQ2_OVIAM|nr:hypothetical protein MG293_000474 [Ovis ammon polii]
MAKRSYPRSEVGGSGLECQAATAQERPRGATLRPRAPSYRSNRRMEKKHQEHSARQSCFFLRHCILKGVCKLTVVDSTENIKSKNRSLFKGELNGGYECGTETGEENYLPFYAEFTLLRFTLLRLFKGIILVKENGLQPSLSKMEMLLVGSRELSDDMEDGHVFLKMLHSFADSITFWQANSSFC